MNTSPGRRTSIPLRILQETLSLLRRKRSVRELTPGPQAVKQFQKVASGSTLEAIEQTVQILFAQLIQFRALNGSAAGHPLPAQLREAADYLEDL
jgi:hypothetical protein